MVLVVAVVGLSSTSSFSGVSLPRRHSRLRSSPISRAACWSPCGERRLSSFAEVPVGVVASTGAFLDANASLLRSSVLDRRGPTNSA